jgi:hypothetical protein
MAAAPNLATRVALMMFNRPGAVREAEPHVTARSVTACAARDAVVTPTAVHADNVDMVYAGARR